MDGVLLFDKPSGWTSHDAVDFIRKKIHDRRVGHAGTLDPLATGLLVMLIGKATKLSQELSGTVKQYRGSMRLGTTTDTQDLEGKILRTAPYTSVTLEAIKKIFSELSGVREQTPPMFSAVKHEGQKLYELARKGIAVQPKTRPIEVESWECLGFEPPEASFLLTCSKGTYVRALCDEAGERLGCGAVLSLLVRTRSGNFSLDDSLKREELEKMNAAEIEKRIIGYENLSRLEKNKS